MAKKRKAPLRKCIVTKEMKLKQDLIRIVRNKEGEVFVDTTGKQNGRGAYISKDAAVIEQAIKTKVFNKQFRMNVNESIYEQLKTIAEGQNNEQK